MYTIYTFFIQKITKITIRFFKIVNGCFICLCITLHLQQSVDFMNNLFFVNIRYKNIELIQSPNGTNLNVPHNVNEQLTNADINDDNDANK